MDEFHLMGKRPRRKPRGITAWLVTWEHMGDHAVPPCRIVAILSYRWSAERVREIVELLYANSYFSPAERIAYAKNKSFNPYPVEFERVHGIRFLGRMTCGHNPFLYARLVENLIADKDCDETQVTWDERPGPDPDKIAKFIGKQ